MEMEDILPKIIGIALGFACIAKAIYDSVKLPGGQLPGNPAPSKPFPARTDILEKEPESLNGIDLLDQEELETIWRVVRVKEKTNARINALNISGLEITNLDKWQ